MAASDQSEIEPMQRWSAKLGGFIPVPVDEAARIRAAVAATELTKPAALTKDYKEKKMKNNEKALAIVDAIVSDGFRGLEAYTVEQAIKDTYQPTAEYVVKRTHNPMNFLQYCKLRLGDEALDINNPSNWGYRQYMNDMMTRGINSEMNVFSEFVMGTMRGLIDDGVYYVQIISNDTVYGSVWVATSKGRAKRMNILTVHPVMPKIIMKSMTKSKFVDNIISLTFRNEVAGFVYLFGYHPFGDAINFQSIKIQRSQLY